MAETKAKAAAERSLALDDKLAEAHNAMAGVYSYEWNWVKAGEEYQRAIALKPGSAILHHDYSLYLNLVKRPEPAIEESKLARDLDPLSLVINTDLGMAYFYARRYDEAIEVYKKSLELEPSFEEAHFYLGEAYMQKGAYPEALAEFQRTVNISHREPLRLTDFGLTYAYSGRPVEAHRTLVQLTGLSQREYVPPDYIAELDAALGRHEEALFWLEKAYTERSSHLINLTIEQAFDPLRSEPRFANLVARLGL